MDFRGRQKRLLTEIEARKLDAVLITHLPNVRYLTGFTGSAGTVLAGKQTLFFTDGRYREQAKQQVKVGKVVVGKSAAFSLAALAIKAAGYWRIGIEAEHLTVAARESFAKELGTSVKLISTSDLVEEFRTVKDKTEVGLIQEAVALGDSSLSTVLSSTKPEQTEISVAAALEHAMRDAGAEGMSFETIIASGPRSALPHGVASRNQIPKRGFVVADYGVILNGYCSDMTRTFCIGRAKAEERSAYSAVLDAQLAAIECVAPGKTAGEVDAAARKILKKARLDRYFIHSTGHGVGLEIHESPRVGSGQKQVLKPGMVITIEPGIYIAGKFGVRIEDMVVVTERGHKVLTTAPKELFEI